jgi:putative ABC transport system substrate-binding protein
LADYGYLDGKNVALEFFTAPSNPEVAAYAMRAVASGPDVLFANGTPPSLAAKNATTSIPTVFFVADPIAIGLVTSMAHPGGNLTGITNQAPGLVSKQLGLLKELLPSLRRLALLNVPADPVSALQTELAKAPADALGIEPVVVDFIEGEDFATQFERVIAAKVDAAHQPAVTYFTQTARDQLFDLLLRHKLPAMGTNFVEGGTTPFIGVINYGASNPGIIRQAVSLIDAILKGAKPGDLPVQQPASWDLGINLDSARKMGLTVPTSILAQATVVVDEDWRAPKAVAK